MSSLKPSGVHLELPISEKPDAGQTIIKRVDGRRSVCSRCKTSNLRGKRLKMRDNQYGRGIV
ncbi:MAG: hypothetical protein HQ557_12410 [Bacteroidetes bacterium]|nr:hypothetical protein [Bacteroidota bacterium]